MEVELTLSRCESGKQKKRDSWKSPENTGRGGRRKGRKRFEKQQETKRKKKEWKKNAIEREEKRERRREEGKKSKERPTRESNISFFLFSACRFWRGQSDPPKGG